MTRCLLIFQQAKEEERFASLNSQLSIAQSKIEELSDRIKLADQQVFRKIFFQLEI